VTALGSLLAGIGAIWVVLAAGPRYRLRYGPLTSRLDDDKWKVHIYLSSRGRRDITRETFDEGKPVELDIGVRILDLGDKLWNSQESTRVVDHRADGTCLLVGPGVIHRQQDLRFTVTAEARPTRLICRASLIDVSVRSMRLTPRQRYEAIQAWAFGVAILFWALADATCTQPAERSGAAGPTLSPAASYSCL
jgi:hypothetical protein